MSVRGENRRENGSHSRGDLVRRSSVTGVLRAEDLALGLGEKPLVFSSEVEQVVATSALRAGFQAAGRIESTAEAHRRTLDRRVSDNRAACVAVIFRPAPPRFAGNGPVFVTVS